MTNTNKSIIYINLSDDMSNVYKKSIEYRTDKFFEEIILTHFNLDIYDYECKGFRKWEHFDGGFVEDDRCMLFVNKKIDSYNYDYDYDYDEYKF